MKRGLIRFPTETVHFAECVETTGAEVAAGVIHADQWVPSLVTGLPVSLAGGEIAIGRHQNSRENYTFVDGHAETASFETTFMYDDYIWEVVHDQWNPAFRLLRREDR